VKWLRRTVQRDFAPKEATRDLQRHGSSGDRSFASTNSSFLATHFPKRYFILKSLTQVGRLFFSCDVASAESLFGSMT
jgi:hypothetical protein